VSEREVRDLPVFQYQATLIIEVYWSAMCPGSNVWNN
jgi:hypothetical protein